MESLSDQTDAAHIRIPAFQEGISNPVGLAVDKLDLFHVFIVFKETVDQPGFLEFHTGEGAVFKGTVLQCAIENNIGEISFVKRCVVQDGVLHRAFLKSSRFR